MRVINVEEFIKKNVTKRNQSFLESDVINAEKDLKKKINKKKQVHL